MEVGADHSTVLGSRSWTFIIVTASTVDAFPDPEEQACGTVIIISVDRQLGSVPSTRSVTLQDVPVPEIT